MPRLIVPYMDEERGTAGILLGIRRVSLREPARGSRYPRRDIGASLRDISGPPNVRNFVMVVLRKS
jgi:hypothetical protein